MSQRQVRQAMEQSGWSTLRQVLAQHSHWTPEQFHLEQEWLVREMLQPVRSLQDCLEKGQPLPQEEQLTLHDVQTLQLRAAVVHIFQARTKRTAQKRYRILLKQKEDYLQRAPPLQWIFAFLEPHWPYLVNAIASQLIPATNNAVEMVIRRFDPHYQNFCGFESIQTAQVYLGVFEKVYRFTPFSRDARPEIRGKSPLHLAGYDLSRIPMSWLCRGYCLEWPLTVESSDVPNS